MPLPCSKKDVKSGLAVRVGRGSVSNENNVLLDPEVLTDYPTQVLVLTVLVRTFYHFIMIIFNIYNDKFKNNNL